MIATQSLELRAGARLLVAGVTVRINHGDRIGFVGRNGSGKSTLARVLAGETMPAGGQVLRSGAIGYLPQDPRTGDEEGTVVERILSVRGLDQIVARMRQAEEAMATAQGEDLESVMNRYTRADNEFNAAGGYSATAEAEAIATSLGIPERLFDQPLESLSGGQRRRIELARILFSAAETLLLDEPTNHLDADSVSWLRDYLLKYSGGLVIISHDVNLIETVVNKVFYLDANRNVIDVYNMGWKKYLLQREQDEHRRKIERANAEKKAAILEKQAEKMRAKATKAKAAQGMFRRAEKLLSGLEDVRKVDRVARLRFPTPSPCGKTPLSATGLSKSYGSLEVFTDVDLAIDKGSRVVILGLNGAGKTTLLRMLSGDLEPDTGEVVEGHGLKIGYYTQEHESLDFERTVLENMSSAHADLREPEARNVLGSFLFSGDDVHKPVKVLSGGERTRLALAVLVVSAANVLLLDEPTNNLDPASRHEILGALGGYQGAVILVSHDEGAVRALNPDRVLLLPDGDEDFWNESYLDLVEID
ncbi:MAG: ABC-F family ATP-binding cassette domain-containing protein [Actinobacteria bacterium]|nr:ABC-F family ATP-binding cassette domain-containing protein [Actinomycetota bacterium]